MAAGLRVTINSDDPAYFGGYVTENYLATQAALNLSLEEVAQLAKNSFTASFLPTEIKQKHLDAIDALYRTFQQSPALTR